jgi:hypothetical protein
MLGAIDHAAIAQGGLDASAPSAGRQFQGSSVCRSRAFVRPETTRSSTSVSQAIGSTPFSFAGADSGGDRAAVIYTIVQTATLNGLNPEAYLRDTLVRIADGHPISRIDALMPWVPLPTADQPASV